MAEVPISPDIQKSYRDTLQIPDSPSFIDTRIPIQPVAVIAQTSVAELAQFQKITDGTDTLEINTDGSINTKPVERTVTYTSGTATTTVITVGASKRAKLVYFNFSGQDNGGGRISVSVNGVVIATCFFDIAHFALSQVIPYELAPIAEATQTIVVTVSAMDEGVWSVGYIEESV